MPEVDNKERRTISDAIITAIQAVSGVASTNVFDGLRRKMQPDEWRASFVEPSGLAVQAWFVYRSRTRTESSETQRGFIAIGSELARYHSFTIELYYGFTESNITDVVVAQSSEEQFQTLIDDVLTAFNAKRTLGTWQVTPLSLMLAHMEPLGAVMCHHAVFDLTAIERISGITPS